MSILTSNGFFNVSNPFLVTSMKLDLHNHTHFSKDANILPTTFLKTAQQKEIGIAITDHNSIDAWKPLQAANRKFNIPLILGEEVMTFDAQGKKTGEVIGLFMNSFVKPGPVDEVLDALHEQGALITVPHPFDTVRNNLKELERVKKRVHAVEVFNARCYTTKANELALQFQQENKTGITAGSDGHTVAELGRAYIENEKLDSLEDMRKAIMKGNVKVVGKRSNLIPHLKTQLIKYNILKDE